jgi:hypothetical protein|nr:MAG TPA: hypothetical protein [Caudoviricetes sp.]
MREWSKKHIEELIKNTGGGGGAVGEGAQTFYISADRTQFREPGSGSEDPASQVLNCSVITKDGSTQEQLRFYRIGGESNPILRVETVTTAGTPVYNPRTKKWEVDISTTLPFMVGLYTKDTTLPQAYCYGVLRVGVKAQSDTLIHARAWEDIYHNISMFVGAGAKSDFGEWTIIQPTSDIGYLGKIGVAMV